LIRKDKGTTGRWLIDGMTSISDTKAALGINELPGERQGNYQTAGGFALWMIGRAKMRLPKVADSFEYDGLRCEVVDIDQRNGYRIEHLRFERIGHADPVESMPAEQVSPG
jgi:CBS domain containing-hemolysin-like protein